MLANRVFARSSLNARRSLACISPCIGASYHRGSASSARRSRPLTRGRGSRQRRSDGAGRGGRFVTGLNEDDFRVYEDGVEQKIAVFEKEDVESAIGILLDNSLSMVDILPMMKTGLLDFAEHTTEFQRTLRHDVRHSGADLPRRGAAHSQLESSLKPLGVQGTSVFVRRARRRIAEGCGAASRSARPSLCLPTASIPQARPVSGTCCSKRKKPELFFISFLSARAF